jgi:hypothetical protein
LCLKTEIVYSNCPTTPISDPCSSVVRFCSSNYPITNLPNYQLSAGRTAMDVLGLRTNQALFLRSGGTAHRPRRNRFGGAPMHKLHPLEVMPDEIFQSRCRYFNPRAVRERDCHCRLPRKFSPWQIDAQGRRQVSESAGQELQSEIIFRITGSLCSFATLVANGFNVWQFRRVLALKPVPSPLSGFRLRA